MRSSNRIVLIAVVAATMIATTPVTAFAANAFGLTYKGEATCLTVGCHSTVNHVTAHDDFAKDVQANPASLVPSSGVTNAWPSPGFGTTGIRANPANIWLQLGSSTGILEYIGLKTSTLPALSGTTVWPTLNPTDDAPLFDGLGYDQASGAWEAEGPVSAVTYFQRCAGCHHLGLTRPGSTLTTLANGLAQIGPSTPTSISGLSIQCEVCHGTGKTGTHMGTGEGVVAWPASGEARILSSEICGQCHVSGTSKEVNITGSAFSHPNGYTPDKTLADYLNVRATVPTPGQFVAGNTTYYFFPNGSTYRARHVYYNEWKISGHSVKLTDSASRVLAAANGNAACLKCHSGEGFLARLGASVVPAGFQATISGSPGAWTSNAKYSQECAICHTSHDTANGLSVRTGATCDVCHNWQYEVLGTTAMPGDTIRHPQREMVNGRGLFDVANGSAFMPGAVWQTATCRPFAEVAIPARRRSARATACCRCSPATPRRGVCVRAGTPVRRATAAAPATSSRRRSKVGRTTSTSWTLPPTRPCGLLAAVRPPVSPRGTIS